ncbi:hypothetical protein B9G39_29340 [Zooshikella ganghwensis]|uniref:Transposase DDE domain-containing protein n=2 Tax=Zooshikella ganghwensis TaxID=202772 RepID=A0A4P9VG21_9GAMM|nr:hypothetical protein B9G39_29340 [Zooshikella ganghwensis]
MSRTPRDFKIPLRQLEGLIDSLFETMGLPLKCPHYSLLSKRLAGLNIPHPVIKKGFNEMSVPLPLLSTPQALSVTVEMNGTRKNIRCRANEVGVSCIWV